MGLPSRVSDLYQKSIGIAYRSAIPTLALFAGITIGYSMKTIWETPHMEVTTNDFQVTFSLKDPSLIMKYGLSDSQQRLFLAGADVYYDLVTAPLKMHTKMKNKACIEEKMEMINEIIDNMSNTSYDSNSKESL